MSDPAVRLLEPFELLFRAAERNPGAVLIDDGTTTVRYREALRLARQLAYRLRSYGVAPGSTLHLDLPPGMHALLTLAGFHEALVTVTARAEQPATEADWLVTTTGESAASRDVIVIDAAFLHDLGDPPPGFAPQRFDGPDAIVRLAVSSGTTGVPKAVRLTLEMIHHRARAARALVVPGEGFLCSLGLGSSSGFHTFLDAIATGTTYLVPSSVHTNLLLIRRHRVASIKVSPWQLAELCDAIDASAEPVPFLRVIYAAGSIVPLAVREKVRRVTSATLVTLYGSTEAGRAAERVLDDDDLDWVGHVAPGTELEIVDEDDRPLPAGTTGVIRYRRAHQAREYDGDPEATARAFRGSWFYPGDRGSLSASGELRLAARATDLINASGMKIDPADAENAAVASGLVLEAAGFGFVDGDGLTRFGLAIVATGEVDLAALNTMLQQTLAGRSPRAIVRLPELPRTTSGKVRRAELQRLYEEAVGSAPSTSP